MSNILAPKEQFQANDDVRKAYADLVHNGHFRTGLTYALSEYVINSAPTKEESIAVRKFIDIMTTLGDKPVLSSNPPSKSLFWGKKPTEKKS